MRLIPIQASDESKPVSSYMLKRCIHTSDMKFKLAFTLVLLFLTASLAPMAEQLNTGTAMAAPSARATGVDLTINSVGFSYTNSVDEGRYRMFSSNHPIPNFDRPAELYVVDAIIDVPIFVELTVENLGTNPSGTIDVTLKMLHNEYQQFEMVNTTLQMASLNGGSSNTIGFTITPSYAGNHSMAAIASTAIADDSPGNNQYTRHFTVASHYFNCDDLSLWTMTNEWGTSTDTFLSEGSACHVGNGQTSTYSASSTSVLETPAFDMSDAVDSPTRTNGLTFFYTGSSQQGDVLKLYIQDSGGTNTELGSITGLVDQSFIDGASWQTFSATHQGATSPLIPAPISEFTPATKFRFVFTSDALNEDIGFWMDDIVIVYDQKVKPIEYAVSSAGVSTTGALPGEWGSVGIALTNNGNISDFVIPAVENLPNDWGVYYSHDTGISINAQSGVLLAPGETKIIHMNLRPDENASIGFNQLTFLATSSQYQTVNTTLPVQFQVLPDREPFIVVPEQRPSCPPGYTCPFEIEVQNIGDATDVFDLSIDQQFLPQGWNVQFSWTQDTSVLVRPDQPVQVALSMTVPVDATPDTVAPFKFHATSQNNSLKHHSVDIDVSASMISEAYVGMTLLQANQDWSIDAGETIDVSFTIWNNASRQDIFSMSVQYQPAGMWHIEQPNRPDAVINPGGSTTFTAKITAPENAQAGDLAPPITPSVTSQRSGMTITGEEFSLVSVRTISDLSLSLIEAPIKLRPGAVNKVIFDLVNNGNGPVEALVVAEDLPESWSVSYRVLGENISGTIPLSAPYDANNNATVEAWIVLPSEEGASEIHTLTFSASSSQGLVDIFEEDNTVSFDTITASVRIPMLTGSGNSTFAMVGSTVSVNATLTNIGNAVDDGIIVRGTYSASPPNPNIVAFFSTGIGATSKSAGEAVEIMLAANESTVISLDLILPSDLMLNSRIVVSFEVIAGMNEEMQPYELTYDALIIVNQQRMIDVELSNSNAMIHPTGVGVPLFVNLTSTSSQSEDFDLSVVLPENWQAVCNGVLLEGNGQNITMEAGHINAQIEDIPCTLHRISGPLEGKLTFNIASKDGVLEWEGSQVFTFSERPSEASSFSVEAAAGGIAILLAFVLLMAISLRKRSNSEDFDLRAEEDHLATNIPNGPPASNGPPIQTVAVSPPIEPERQNMLEEQGPAVPVDGLPQGWTMEQWNHYGQQYLDRMKGQA